MKTPAMPLPLGFVAAGLALCVAAAPATASIMDDFNAATLITDFQFDDTLGTPIESTLNSADPAAPFDGDTDFSGAATNGSGQFDASGKDNTSLGTAYSDTALIDSGRVIALYDVAWEFDESVYDSAQDEEFRLSLMLNDPRSTFVTAEIFFTRTSATEVTLFGNGVGTGALDTDEVVFGSSGSLLTMLDANIDTGVFELLYSSDSGASFTSAGTGTIGENPNTPETDFRSIEAVRLVLNEDFTDDTLLVERFAVAKTIPEPTTLLLVCGGLLFVSARSARR